MDNFKWTIQCYFHQPIFNIEHSLVPRESYAKEPVFSTVYKGVVENSSNAYICP